MGKEERRGWEYGQRQDDKKKEHANGMSWYRLRSTAREAGWWNTCEDPSAKTCPLSQQQSIHSLLTSLKDPSPKRFDCSCGTCGCFWAKIGQSLHSSQLDQVIIDQSQSLQCPLLIFGGKITLSTASTSSLYCDQGDRCLVTDIAVWVAEKCQVIDDLHAIRMVCWIRLKSQELELSWSLTLVIMAITSE